ncbi:MAG: PPC domain-containing protein [Pirellulales bacterium]
MLFRFLAVLLVAGWTVPAAAQLAPEIGYVFPAGGPPGTTFDVVLGGYDWSPDMQLLPADPRVKIELLGPPSPVLVPDPPYWFGAKARGPAWPLPREFPARITLPADLPPGLLRWQVANANGASPAGFLHVGGGTPVVEDAQRQGPQPLPSFPVTVSGQIRRIEEIDRYAFQLPVAAPVTLTLIARQLGSPLHALIQVHDESGRRVLDVADTQGRDLVATFPAAAATTYVVSLHDLDFAGDRSYVYRLTLSAEPRVVASFPARGQRGTKRAVEFHGWGLATGAGNWETVTREIEFPATATGDRFACSLPTPAGPAAPWILEVGDESDEVEPAGGQGMPLPRVPIAVTGSLDTPFAADDYPVALTKATAWRIAAEARTSDAPLDLDLTVVGPDGKELANQDDAPATTDPVLVFQPPADGTYRIVVSDRTGCRLGRAARYRLRIEPQGEDFSAKFPEQLAVPLGARGKLPISLTRLGGFKQPVQLQFTGLPEGVKLVGDGLIAADKNDLPLELECAADAPASAALVHVAAATRLGEREVVRPLGTVLVATTLRPAFKITPEGLDDVRKVHRGSTYLAPLLIERLEGFAGPITLEMTSKQQRHRQGLASGEWPVAPAETRVEYPIFVPEWMETTKTSRMILNGTARVRDPRGHERTLVQRMELRIGILPEGALLKVTPLADEPRAPAGGEIEIPVKVARAPEFREPVKLDVRPSADSQPREGTPEVLLEPTQSEARVKIQIPADARRGGVTAWTIRARALRDDRWPVVSETTVTIAVP